MCGRILADLGADVILLEPAGGSPARRSPPLHAGHSLNWLIGSLNKRSVTCEVPSPMFDRLLAHADVVVQTDHVLDYAVLAEHHPWLIVATLTPFGSWGPLADTSASDLEITAASGALWLAGEPDRPPVRTSVPQTPFWTGMYAAAGVLMAVLARDLTGRGQHVDVSAQASMLTATSQAPIFWDLLGEEQRRSGEFLVGRSITGARFRNVWPCRDGHVTFALYGGQAGRETARALCAWMADELPDGVPEPLRSLDWEQFDVATASQELVSSIELAIAPFFASLTKAEFLTGVTARNMLGYPVSTVADVAEDQQLACRNFWQTAPAPWRGEMCLPGGFAVFDGERPTVRRGSPMPGEHTDEVLAELGLGLGLEVAALV